MGDDGRSPRIGTTPSQSTSKDADEWRNFSLTLTSADQRAEITLGGKSAAIAPSQEIVCRSFDDAPGAGFVRL